MLSTYLNEIRISYARNMFLHTDMPMIEKQPYKENMPEEAALAEIQRQKGKQFDPVLADIFCKVMLCRTEQ